MRASKSLVMDLPNVTTNGGQQMPKLVALPLRDYPKIYVNPTRVTVIREHGEHGLTVVHFEGKNRELVALHIEKVRELLDNAMV